MGLVWVGLINVSYYLCMFKSLEIAWWTEYSKQMTFWFGIIVGALTLTDIAFLIKEGYTKGNGTPSK